MSTSIHPTAIVDRHAELGVDVVIGPYAIVEANVVIGDRTRIGSHAVIREYTRMGTENRIHPHAVVGGEPQDLKFHGEVTWLEIGDRNSIREFSTMHRGTEGGGGVTRIGNHNLCMAYTHVAHDCQLGNYVVMSNCATLAGHVSVGDYAILSGLSAVHQFTRIGRHAFLGGMSAVAQDIPPWMLVTGARGVVIGPNIVGLRRANVAPEVVRAFKEAYRLIWRSGLNRQHALAELTNAYGHLPEVAEFVDFIRTAERGICAGEKIAANSSQDA